MLTPFLDDLESQINEEEERNLLCRWKDFYEGKINADIFIAERKKPIPARVKWPPIVINEAIKANGFDKMIIRELGGASSALENGTGNVLCIRSNYGTGILPSAFGADIFYLDDSADTLPTSMPIDGKDKIKAIIDNGIPRKKRALCKKSLNAPNTTLAQ